MNWIKHIMFPLGSAVPRQDEVGQDRDAVLAEWGEEAAGHAVRGHQQGSQPATEACAVAAHFEYALGRQAFQFFLQLQEILQNSFHFL